MNIRHRTMNPVELLRIKHDMTQAELAEQLGFKDASDYHRNLRRFSPRLIAGIYEYFGVDISGDIIAFLCGENRRLANEMSTQKGTQKTKRDNKKSDASFDDVVARIL